MRHSEHSDISIAQVSTCFFVFFFFFFCDVKSIFLSCEKLQAQRTRLDDGSGESAATVAFFFRDLTQPVHCVPSHVSLGATSQDRQRPTQNWRWAASLTRSPLTATPKDMPLHSACRRPRLIRNEG